MEKGTKICKVCGKVYPYCKNWNSNDIFRWQDVACCEEHGKQYFAEVLAARGEQPVQEEAPKKKPAKKEPASEE